VIVAESGPVTLIYLKATVSEEELFGNIERGQTKHSTEERTNQRKWV